MPSEARLNRRPRSRIGVAAIFKNEAPYVIEWLAHHRLMGIDDFFIADNDSSDQTRDLLQQLSNAGMLSWIPWPDAPGEKPQLPAYRHLLSRFGNTVDWIAFIDADEYIWETSEQRLVDFLDSMPNDVGAIALNWATYGSSDQYFHHPANTTERFIWHADTDNLVNHNFKTIARSSAIREFTCPHNVLIHPQLRYIHTDNTPKESLNSGNRTQKYAHCQSKEIHWEHFRINHYIIRSWEEYAKKKSSRGRAYSTSELNELYFWGHDFHEMSTQPSQPYNTLLQHEVNKIRELINPATLLEIQSILNHQNVPPSPILGNIESVKLANDITIMGWALEWTRHRLKKIDIIINKYHRVTDFETTLLPRPDVLLHHKGADLLCGFSITTTNMLQESIHSVEIRGSSAQNWTTMPLIWKSNTKTNNFILNSNQPDETGPR